MLLRLGPQLRLGEGDEGLQASRGGVMLCPLRTFSKDDRSLLQIQMLLLLLQEMLPLVDGRSQGDGLLPAHRKLRP
jgi:hypothetical protein